MKRFLIVLGICWLAAVSTRSANGQQDKSQKKSEDRPLALAKREARMLDDIYKTAIVLITKHYVNDENDLAAGEAFKALFQAVEKNGWHKVRLIDATDNPYNDDNAPADKFEKDAVKALLGGKAIYDEVVKKKGKRYLRRATAVPVVMDKCIICHDHYEDVKKGTPVGALSYTIPIQDE